MLKRGSDLGLEPHILEVECDDYAELLDRDGEIDNERLLALVTRLLLEKALALAAREQPRGRAVVLYGGALHNELEPQADLARFSFAPRLQAALGGRYLQVTLLVPEIVEADATARDEPWFDCLALAGADRALLLERSPSARFLVFPRTARAAAGRR